MLTHRCNQYILRDIQEGLIERSKQNRRVLNEEQNLFQKIFFNSNRPFFIRSKLLDLLHDQRLALAYVNQYMLLAQFLYILRSFFYCRFSSEETMTASHVASFHTCKFNRHDIRAE